MGGSGSGRRWHLGARNTTEDSMAIDVRCWRKAGLLTPGASFVTQWHRAGKEVGSIRVRAQSGCVELSYRHRSIGGEWKEAHYPVVLEWMPCNAGGQRPWFRCPVWSCGRRVAILYNNGLFACRHCCELAYPSQRKSNAERAARKANRIRKKLGWQPGLFSPKGGKPKGMHWRTFLRLTTEYQMRDRRASVAMIRSLGIGP